MRLRDSLARVRPQNAGALVKNLYDEKALRDLFCGVLSSRFVLFCVQLLSAN